MLSWIINLSGLVLSGFFTDIRSESVIESTFCPLLVVIFLINIVCKIYNRKASKTEDEPDSVGAGGVDDCGVDDCGVDDCGGGGGDC